MSSKLVVRYNEINRELDAIQRGVVGQKDSEDIQQKVNQLKIEQDHLQQTMRFTALFHLRDEARRALSYGTEPYMER